MKARFWFYSSATIIAVALTIWGLSAKNRTALEQAAIDERGVAEQVVRMKNYAAKQTDERKLVSLAKRLKNQNPEVLRPLIERAYTLNPNSRDIALLASYYRPELKARVLELDPLYKLGD